MKQIFLLLEKTSKNMWISKYYKLSTAVTEINVHIAKKILVNLGGGWEQVWTTRNIAQQQVICRIIIRRAGHNRS